MKKLTFLFAVILVSGLTMAQTNLSQISQTDQSQTAVVDQQGGYTNSFIIQSNQGNNATVTQIKTSEDPTDVIFSTINQSGKRNQATVIQNHNRGGAYPGAGGLIEATIGQSGNDNNATQIQGPHSQIGSSYANIMQSGNSNEAYQIQVRYGNTAYLTQSGSNNTGRQAQDTQLPDDATGSVNSATLTQSGNWNTGEQVQNGWSNEAYLEQSGNHNTAYQTQTSWQSEVIAIQSGNNNLSEQTQIGNLNSAITVQNSSDNTASQTQDGGNVRRSGNPDYSPFNVAAIYQSGGNDNVAHQMQTSIGGDVDANYAATWQEGADNFASQTQAGGFNYSAISQMGNSNSATVTQSMTVIP